MIRDASIVVLLLTLAAGLAGAEDAPAPGAPPAAAAPPAAPPAAPVPKPPPAPTPTPEQAANAVVAALAAKDDAALKALASKDDPDPWLVADELIRRGSFDAAEAFAKAAPRVDTEKLPAYVASRRGIPDDPARRELLAKTNAALVAGRPADALEALGPPDPGAIEDIVGVRLAMLRGTALRGLVQLDASAAAFLVAGDVAEGIGWLARSATALRESGASAYSGTAFAAARQTWERELSTRKRRGDKAGAAKTLCNIGVAHGALRDHAKALAVFERALVVQEALEDRRGVAWTLGNIGVVYKELGEFDKALSIQERALAAQEELEDRRGAAWTLGNIGNLHSELGDFAKALSIHERALTAQESLGDQAGVAKTLGNIGNDCWLLGDHATALAAYERALAALESMGDRAGVATTLGNLGQAYFSLCEYTKALAINERALAAKESLGDKAGAARTLGDIAQVHFRLGDYAIAISAYERALAAKESVGDSAWAIGTLADLGSVHFSMGGSAKALVLYEYALAAQQALDDRAGAASILGLIGNVHRSRGDYSRALSTYERALSTMEALGKEGEAASMLAAMGCAHDSLGDSKKALALYERALAAQESLGDREGSAVTLNNIGVVYARLGDYLKALSILERTLALDEALGGKAGAAVTLSNIAGVHANLGAYGKAALIARRAVSLLESTTRGLSAEEGAGSRAPLSVVYEVGVEAALAMKDASEAAFFLESGRAGALLEGLAARGALMECAVPEDLRRSEAVARTKQAAASQALHKALDKGDAAAEAARRSELEAASEQVASVVARIQREAKAGAAIVYPVAATLDEIRATPAPGDALVLYALLEKDVAALVVTKDDARIVPLGLRAPIDAAAAAVTQALPDQATDAAAALSALATLVVKPLALPAGTTRVLVSPTGSLSYVPFALLVPDVPVTYVPSGTTYRLLREDEALQGDGVLALGDPDYGTKSDPHAMAVYVGRAVGLEPLRASREEAKAVGTVTLLGADATEARLRSAIAERKRWRSVHLACHGLVNTERPALSSLAVTASGDDDGFLSCLDVFGMKVPADLVVLSACETGKGKVVKGEGLVGLTRAFMFAGSPRVLCSLWKVDDAATQFLMTRFYELWNPKEGVGLPASEALRRAQASVREHEVEVEDPASVATGHVRRVKVKPWAHPTFWAAWVLWGLPS